MAFGGWQARLSDATLDDVFGPQAESLELWDRLRDPWGLVAVAEEIAQSLAIRGYHEEAFVLWGAVDSTGIQAPSKVDRSRTPIPYIADVSEQQADAWRAQGASDDDRPDHRIRPSHPRNHPHLNIAHANVHDSMSDPRVRYGAA